MHDAPGQPDAPGELVVQVDGEIVTRRRCVALGLILRDPMRDLGQRLHALDDQPVVRCAFAHRCGRLDASEELRDELLVDELAVLRAGLGPDHEGGAVGARDQRDGRRARDEPHPCIDRPVDDDVVLVVDHPPAGILRGDRQRRRRDGLPGGDDGEDRPPWRVVGRGRVRAEGGVGDDVLLRVPADADRVEVEAHRVLLTVAGSPWLPFPVRRCGGAAPARRR